jgi:Zn-dependent protease
VNAVPIVPLDGGSVVKASLEAAPALIAILVLVALVSPEEAAVSVYVLEVFSIRLEKVATPPTAETVVVPVTPEAVEVIVTEAVEEVTRLPLASST